MFIAAFIMSAKYAARDVSHMKRTIDGNSSFTTVDLLTNNTFIKESSLSTIDKNRKIIDIYMSSKWLEESEYEAIKI